MDKTVDELQYSLQTIAQSWIDARYKRQISQLREATGSADTFVFDGYMMCCDQQSRARRMKLYTLDAATPDPVSQEPVSSLKVGGDLSRNKDSLGPISVECYDAGQDLLAFVHFRANRWVLKPL